MSKPRQSGFMLIEVLISVLIFSVGVIALVSLQASMTRAQTDAKARADASYLATELVGLMWADMAHLGNYTSAQCASTTQCNMWLTKLGQTLPLNTPPVITIDTPTGDVTILITWQPPNGEVRRYQMNTSIKS